MGSYLYLAGFAAVILALFIGRGRSHSLKAGNITNSTVTNGDTNSVSPQPSPPKPQGDRVAWVIAIIGVLVAGAQLTHDVMKP